MTVVLDASAMLALLLDEPGAQVVADALDAAVLSAVNLAEVLSKLTDRRQDVTGLADQLLSAGVLIAPMLEVDGIEVAALRQRDSGRLLSLGDRCCLALGRRLDAQVLTADRAWALVDTGAQVVLVR